MKPVCLSFVAVSPSYTASWEAFGFCHPDSITRFVMSIFIASVHRGVVYYCLLRQFLGEDLELGLRAVCFMNSEF